MGRSKKNSNTRTIYLSKEIVEALADREDLNVSAICRVALASACDMEGTPTKSVDLAANLSEVENELRNTRRVLEGIARRAAKQAGMIILSEGEYSTYKDMLDMGMDGFVRRVRAQAITDYKKQQQAKREKAAEKRKAKRAERLSASSEVSEVPEPTQVSLGGSQNVVINYEDMIPDTKNTMNTFGGAAQQKGAVPVDTPAQCSRCGGDADIKCASENCDNFLCWFCWEDSSDEAEPGLCPKCVSEIRSEASEQLS